MKKLGALLSVLSFSVFALAANPVVSLTQPTIALDHVTAQGQSANWYDLTNVSAAWVQVTEGIVTPTAPSLALVVTGTGNTTNGSHLCEVTYVTAGGISAASPASNAVTVDASDKQITVTIPVSPDAAVTGRNVYCSKANTTSPIFLVATSPVVGDNTSTTYTLNIADASFTATQAPTTSTITTSSATVQFLWRPTTASPSCVVGTITNPSATQVGWMGPGGGQFAVNVSSYTSGTLTAVVGPITKAGF